MVISIQYNLTIIVKRNFLIGYTISPIKKSLQEIPLIFCMDRSGLVGEDGPTHHGVFDISFMTLETSEKISI